MLCRSPNLEELTLEGDKMMIFALCLEANVKEHDAESSMTLYLPRLKHLHGMTERMCRADPMLLEHHRDNLSQIAPLLKSNCRHASSVFYGLCGVR